MILFVITQFIYKVTADVGGRWRRERPHRGRSAEHRGTADTTLHDYTTRYYSTQHTTAREGGSSGRAHAAHCTARGGGGAERAVTMRASRELARAHRPTYAATVHRLLHYHNK